MITANAHGELRPYIDGWYYVPLSRLECNRVQKVLTIKPRAFADKPAPDPILAYDMSREGYIGLPIDWGMVNFPMDGIEDRTSLGGELIAPKRPDPNHPRAAEGQAEFASSLLTAVRDNCAVLVHAGTGTGKTVVTLNAMAELGRTSLAIAPKTFIVNQWRDYAMEHLGLSKDDIFIVKGSKYSMDHPLCLTTYKSAAEFEYPREFYERFGFVAWDEVHRAGAQSFFRTLGLYPAAYKVALTATPKRADKTERTFLYYFGEGQVKAHMDALPIDVHVLDYRGGPVWGDDHATKMLCLSKDKRRNAKIVDLIVKSYKQGRTFLAIGERIDHLEKLQEACRRAGIPDAEMGLFAGSFSDGAKRSKVSDEFKYWVRDHARVAFCTYGAANEGVDFARYDTGIDITPQGSNGLQVIGRLRRSWPGKLSLRWYTIRDVMSRILMNYYVARAKEWRTDPKVTVRLP